MHKPLISIIFPTFKRSEEVVFNLNFFRENISVPYEVFILDNSPVQMNYHFAENENYIFLNKNVGTSSRNIGIQKAQSPICLLLDDDSHPFPGTVENLIKEFKTLPQNCAGLISEIHNPNGKREASLLPTVFHGAGVAFKTEVLNSHNIFYPENYRFYGEEYRMTLEIYRAGLYLEDSADFKVMHRRSDKERRLDKIFYYLGRNNAAIWQNIVPAKYLEMVLYDSQRRYELTAQKENVTDSFEEGLREKLKASEETPMTENQFESLALINQFESLPDNETYILCGTGKFPSLWATQLEQKNCRVYISDFNPGLIGNSFKNFTVIDPEKALEKEGHFLTGHSSQIDTLNWQKLLKDNSKDYLDLSSRHELNAV